MAQDFIPARDALLRCPYDESHSVKAGRFTRHLIKCGRNHPKLSVCPFNATHLCPESELAKHIENCVDKVIVERQIVIPNICQKKQSGNIEIPYHEPADISFPSTENWDLECGQHRYTYDPSEAMSKARYLNPSFLSKMKPAEKRLYHKKLLESSRSESSASANDAAINDMDKQFKAMGIPRPPRKEASYDGDVSDNVLHSSLSPTPSSASASSTFVGLGRGKNFFVETSSVKPGSFVFERPQYLARGRGRGFDGGSSSTGFRVGSHMDYRSKEVVSPFYGSDSDGELSISVATSEASTTVASGEDWRLDCSNSGSSNLSDDYWSTQDDSASLDMCDWSSCSGSLSVHSPPALYDSALLTYIIDRLSTFGLIDECSSFNSFQIENIVENLARINLNVDSSSTSSHESYLVQYITDYLARLGID